MTRLNPALAGLAALCCAALSATVATAPGLADPPAEAAGTASTETASDGPIRIRNVNGYAVLDRQHLVLRAGASRRYLVTLQRRCLGLRFGTRLGLSIGNFSTIHNPHFEYVVTDEDRCYFDTIEPVDSNDAARALIAARAEAEAAEAAEGESMR